MAPLAGIIRSGDYLSINSLKAS